MTPLTYPNAQQEAALLEQAQRLRASYAAFPKPTPEPYERSAWRQLKGYVEFALERPPKAFDWREHVPVPPAKFQGDCYSCTSFAAAATIEIATMITYNTQAPDVAAQYLHTCVVHRGNGNPAEICSFGIEPRRLLMLLKETGYAVSLSDATPFPPMSCSEVGTYTTMRGFSEVPVAAARARLTREPIVTDMYVWDDFFDYTTLRAPSYSPNMLLGEPRLHSVCVVGYTADAWTIKNSFGSGWGDGTGFGRIKMGTCGLLTDNPPPGWARRPAYTVQV